MQPSELIILAARPSKGKTALALNVAARSSVPALVFSLEMTKQQLTERLVASEGRIDGQRMRTGHLLKQEWTALVAATGAVSEMPIFIDDTPAQTLLQIRSKARRWRSDPALFHPEAKHAKGLVIVDYIQLMRGEGETREREVAGFSQGLKALAKELELPVVALSQLKRPKDWRQAAQRPGLQDLRESGSLEQDADVVIFIHEPQRKKSKKDDDVKADETTHEVILEKQRNGPTGIVKVKFFKEFSRFDSITQRDDEGAAA